MLKDIKMNDKNTKIVFMGSADFSVPILLELIKKFDVRAIVTEIDKPVGRKKEIIPPPTKKLAKQHGIPCLQPLKVTKNPNLWDQIAAYEPDLIVVAAYGKILPNQIINLPEHGCVNVHPSLLPKYRGASPIQSALLNGEKKTGTTFILMDEGMDTGDIIYQEEVIVKENEGYNSLAVRLANLSALKLGEIIPDYIKGNMTLTVQSDDEATYCHKITKENGRIDWSQSAEQISNQIRAYDNWPGTYTLFKSKKLDIVSASPSNLKVEEKLDVGQIVKIGKSIFVKCGQGLLQLESVKPAGKKEMPALSYINGRPEFLKAVLV